MEQLINLQSPSVLEQRVEMSVAEYTEAVKRAAGHFETGINMVWQLGTRAVKMAYGGSKYAPDFVAALLNNLPQDAARQTFDWLKKAGINVNRPQLGSKLYWLSISGTEEAPIITARIPGSEGYGLVMEKALHYVKTTPPIAMERREGKGAKAVKVLSGPAKNRANEAIIKAMKRLQKDDPDAAREVNDWLTTIDAQQSCLYDASGTRQKLADVELKVANEAISAINNGVIDADTILKVLSGNYKVVLEEIAEPQQ